MTKQKMIQDFNSLSNGNLDNFIKNYENNIKEYSFYIYRKEHSNTENSFWDVDITKLNQENLIKLTNDKLIILAEEKGFSNIKEYLLSK